MDVKRELVVIVPAAGQGTRFGGLGAKELSLHPAGLNGENLIDYAISKARSIGARTLIISRQDKNDLNLYLEKVKAVDVEIMLLDWTREWTDSILKSCKFWGQHNIVLLPDTTFSPDSGLETIALWLKEAPIVLGTFQVDDPGAWGVIEGLRLWEKPTHLKGKAQAWGLLGFGRDQGEKLFSSLLNPIAQERFFRLPLGTKLMALDSFLDFTRQKK